MNYGWILIKDGVNNKLENWNPIFELAYWNSKNRDDSFYLYDIQRLHEFFRVEDVANLCFQEREIETVVDIGSGAYGGELHFFKKGNKRIIFDLLCDDYQKMGKLPKDIECITGDFASIPFETNSVDIIFAWEVLDHALSLEHFEKGQEEIVRILKPNGLLFFNHPLVSKPKSGHTVIKTKEEIIKKFLSFDNMKLVFCKINIETTKVKDGELCCIFTKEDNV